VHISELTVQYTTLIFPQYTGSKKIFWYVVGGGRDVQRICKYVFIVHLLDLGM
jgi:hypothetical protein